MFPVSVLRHALTILVPLSLVLSSYLYLYPVFHGCAFPSPENDATTAYANTLQQHTLFNPRDGSKVAPFRLLALGDPQLEGDSSIPDPEAATFPHLSKFWGHAFSAKESSLQRLRHSLHDLIDFYLDDIPKALEVWRKQIDHVGNDYYLGHIYRTLHWWTKPTHVTVLGDLVGSQWIDDDEFESRGWRFWKRVFRGGERVSDEIAAAPSDEFNDTWILGADAKAWTRRIINVAGNHDIGYAGDLSPERMTRFVRMFGKANYELRFQLPVKLPKNNTISGADGELVEDAKPVPEVRIVVLNDMNLDTPASSKELQDETYKFLNDIITTSQDVTREAHFTLVLTHIPMYKKEGICVDGPFFDFFSGDFDNGVKEQNHLSADASKGFLEGIFGMSGHSEVPGHGFGRNGLILTGHDHEGCDIYHYINQSSDPLERQWEAQRWNDAHASGLFDETGIPGLREITVRSMMGDFSGNAGLLSLWFDEETWDWRFEFANCRMGKQHIWWVVHILNLITIGVGVAYGVITLVDHAVWTDSASKGMLKKHTRNEKTNGLATKIKNHEDGAMDASLTEYLKPDGNLDVPGAGKKSLRKKKSKVLTGSSLNGSAVSRI